MDLLENRDIVVEGLHFRDLDDLEDYCAHFPEFEDAVVASGVMTILEHKNALDTYLLAAELDYGNGDNDLSPWVRYGWYGEVFIDPYC